MFVLDVVALVLPVVVVTDGGVAALFVLLVAVALVIVRVSRSRAFVPRWSQDLMCSYSQALMLSCSRSLVLS